MIYSVHALRTIVKKDLKSNEDIFTESFSFNFKDKNDAIKFYEEKTKKLENGEEIYHAIKDLRVVSFKRHEDSNIFSIYYENDDFFVNEEILLRPNPVFGTK